MRPSKFFSARIVAVLGLALVLTGTPAVPAQADGDVLYGAIVMATKEDRPAEPPAELRSQVANLESVFGYNQFRILGQNRKTVTAGTENWVVPSKKFFLRVDTKAPAPNGYALGLQLRRDENVIITADVKLSRERPLYIRGPLVGEGQLIILLMVL